jgi:hypothetical protein
MITRAYQNAKGERQEVAMTVAEWEALTVEQLDEMLGFKAPAPAPAPAPVKTVKAAKAAPAPVVEPVAEPEAKVE